MGSVRHISLTVILHKFVMIRLLSSFGVLFVLVAVTEASSTKYRHSSYDDDYKQDKHDQEDQDSYKHDHDYYKDNYEHETYGDNKYGHGYGKKHVTYAKSYEHEPVPEYYEEYEEPSYGKYEEYDHKPTYKHKYEPTYRHKRSVFGYGGDSYGKSYSPYSSYKPSYRHKRSTVREEMSGLATSVKEMAIARIGQDGKKAVVGRREGQCDCFEICDDSCGCCEVICAC